MKRRFDHTLCAVDKHAETSSVVCCPCSPQTTMFIGFYMSFGNTMLVVGYMNVSLHHVTNQTCIPCAALCRFQHATLREGSSCCEFLGIWAQPETLAVPQGSLPPSMRVAATARAVNKVREATLKSLRRRSRKAAFAFVIAVAGGTIASEIISGRSNAPVVKWHVLFLGMTALLAAWTSFAENDLHSLDFTQSRYGQSKSKNKDGS